VKGILPRFTWRTLDSVARDKRSPHGTRLALATLRHSTSFRTTRASIVFLQSAVKMVSHPHINLSTLELERLNDDGTHGNQKIGAAKGFETIRDHRPVSAETGVISHESMSNTPLGFLQTRSENTFLRTRFVIRSHAYPT
jgi:hypothetical protein